MISKKSNEKKGMKKHFTEDEQMAKKKKKHMERCSNH
jgi:hypothetical protein